MKDQLIHYQAEARCSLKRVQEIAQEMGDYDLNAEDIMKQTNHIYNALEGMLKLSLPLKSEAGANAESQHQTELNLNMVTGEKENDLVYGLTEQNQYRFYQAHHLSVVLASFFAESDDIYIHSESLYVMAAMIRDLTDPNQAQSLNSGNKKAE